jgi:hypothetical protein
MMNKKVVAVANIDQENLENQENRENLEDQENIVVIKIVDDEPYNKAQIHNKKFLKQLKIAKEGK